LFICLLLVDGWAFSTLWTWLIVPVFTAPVLGIGQSIGILVFLTVAGVRNPKHDNFIEALTFGPISVLLGLGIKTLFGI